MTDAELRQHLRDICVPTQRDWAERHGFSQAFIGQVINGHSNPSPRLLEALGLCKVVRYVDVDAQTT